MTTITIGARLAAQVRRRHSQCLRLFAVVVVLHWIEHLVQAFQIHALDWPVPQARGVLGIPFPWLIQAEVMHYGYALVMLVMLWMLKDGLTGRARQWWMLACWLQF